MSDNNGERPEPVVPLAYRDFFNIIVLGALAGLLIWTIGLMLNRFVLDPYLCQGESTESCGSAVNYSAIVAIIIVSIGALVALMRIRVYRPLLVVLATMVATWGVPQSSWEVIWYQGMGVTVVLFALALGAFAWLARLRQFWPSLGAMIVLIVVVRLILTS